MMLGLGLFLGPDDILLSKQDGFWYSPESGEKDSAGYSPESGE